MFFDCPSKQGELSENMLQTLFQYLTLQTVCTEITEIMAVFVIPFPQAPCCTTLTPASRQWSELLKFKRAVKLPRQVSAEKVSVEANMKIEGLETEVAALKTLVLTSTPSQPNKHLHPQVSMHAFVPSYSIHVYVWDHA